MERAQILRALHGHAERFVLLTEATVGGEVADLGDALLTSAGPKSVFFVGEHPDHAAVLDEARRWFRARDAASFMVLARRGFDDAVQRLVPTNALVSTPACMALTPATRRQTARPPDGLVVEELRGPDGMAEYLRVSALGFEEAPDAQSIFYPPALADRGDVRFFVGSIDGEPVASAGAVAATSGLGVYGVATVPSHRRRGVGTAMTEHVLDSGSWELAFLQPTDMAAGMYERLGFRTVGGYRLYRVDQTG